YMVFFKSSLGTGDIFGTNKAMAQYEASRKGASKPAPSAASTSSITPIYKDGQLVFTNRKGN
ncbi:MAG: hypothetical protein PHI97_33440, partial [Desulfobulbus sp.]|nr:hypothetical protein [Desulfobulbus sp.]